MMSEIPEPRLNFDTEWRYAPAPESTDDLQLRDRYDLLPPNP